MKDNCVNIKLTFFLVGKAKIIISHENVDWECEKLFLHFAFVFLNQFGGFCFELGD
jgi:hypothetical protein